MTMPPAVRPTPTGIRVELRVIPRAPRNVIAGERDGRILIRVTAPPVDRAANDAVIALLAEVLHVPKRAIRIVAGETARNKSIEIDGVGTGALSHAMQQAVPARRAED
jgi:uncharacterized protein (TIGR00251 family)